MIFNFNFPEFIFFSCASFLANEWYQQISIIRTLQQIKISATSREVATLLALASTSVSPLLKAGKSIGPNATKIRFSDR